jgi:hypothetical protein
VFGQTDKQFRIDRPATAVATRCQMIGSGVDTDISSIAATLAYAGYHTPATAYDSITLLVGSGTMVGSISVHGVI